MKFGAVPDTTLASLDLRLPPEPAENASVLSGSRMAKPAVYIGAATWGASSWNGILYPPKTPATQFRNLYPQYFNAVELNATHYNIYPPEVLRQWAAPAKDRDFLFCPKFPQSISHYSGFQQTEGLTAAFLESVEALGPHLGPLFLQVSETASPTQEAALLAYLAALPPTHRYFLELRHPDWFSNAQRTPAFFSRLHTLGVGTVITDAPGRRDVVHMRLTLPQLFLRFVCNGLDPTSYSRLDAWVGQLATWLDAGLEAAYIFLHPGTDDAVPPLAAYLTEHLNRLAGLQMAVPAPTQQRLF